MNISVNAKVSVIICFYNTQQYLKEAVESVLDQDYKHWELILIDDGSSDNSSAIAKEYQTKYSEKIFYYDHENHANKGLSASRNFGIAKASGELIAFLDADDIFLPAYLLTQVNILQNHQVSMVCEATEYWYSWSNQHLDNTIIPVGINQDQVYNPPELIHILYPLGKGDAPCMCGILIKKEALIKSKGFDESFTGMYEDQVFLTKIYLNEPVYISSKCNNKYRQRSDSMMGSSHFNGEYYQVRKLYLDWLENYLNTNNINIPSLNELLQKAMEPPPLVSVIIAFLNEEKFLGEAIESVISQDYPNWELILVDDGSNDGSIKIAKEYSTKYPGKIFYHHHENHANKGLSASRNEGIKIAKGKLVAFLDADDVWLGRKISEQVFYFEKFPDIAMIAEASKYWYSYTTSIKKDKIIPVGAYQDKVYKPTELSFFLYPLGTGAAPCPSSLMLKKATILEVGGFEESFTNKHQLYEDQAFLFKIYINYEVYVSSSCNNLYRQRVGSIVQKVKADGHYHIVRRDFLKWVQGYLQTAGIRNAQLNKSIEKALYPYNHPYLHNIFTILPGALKKFSKRLIRKTASQFIKN